MTYSSRDRSIAEGMPFECYEFETPLGTFLYTSLTEAVTLGGREFVPCNGLNRTEAEINGIVDSLQTMNFIVPRDDPLALGFNRRNLPEYCTTKVYRAHYGEDLSTQFKIEWRGEATGYSYAQDGGFIIETQSILQAKIQGSQCTIYTQLSCNHRVYDSRCGVVKADHTVSAVVTKVDSVIVSVDNQGYASDLLQLGEAVNTRTGEKRMIYNAGGNKITVTYPFVDIKIGDVVELSKGCNNLMSTCIARFDNVKNFLGFRYIPIDNIFADSGDKVVKTTTTKRQFTPIVWSVSSQTTRR